jgi:hypothetical protein
VPRAALVVLAAIALSVAGCGGGESSKTTPSTSAPTTAKRPPRPRGPIPPALRTVESASEDTIDFALAGRRDKAIRTSRALKKAADGPAAAELRAAGVSAGIIDAFRDRAHEVARLAPKADLLRVALASNRAFGMVPGFFALYRSAVPATVTRLDYLDFEAKLRSRAGDAGPVLAAVERLDATWTALRPDFVRAGGRRVAPRFDAHVRAMRRLASAGDLARAQKEAQHGLDLVDELEQVYERK